MEELEPKAFEKAKCKVCGSEFIRKSRINIYCSKDCQKQVQQKKLHNQVRALTDSLNPTHNNTI